MTVLLRSLVVWLMLLALPYQGYAAAAMMVCAPVAESSPHEAMQDMPHGPHDHAAMLAAMAQDQPDGSSSHAGHAHGSVKCGGAACCIAGAPVMSDLAVMPVLPAVSGAIAFYSGFLPAVDLAHPERPPQAHFA
jgi:hypothetical protein